MTDRIARTMLFAIGVVTFTIAETLAAPAPPSEVVAYDAPGDVGTRVIVKWEKSPDDVSGNSPRLVDLYRVFRRSSEEQDFKPVGDATYGRGEFTDTNAERGKEYWYRVTAVGPDLTESAAAETAGSIVPEMEYFDFRRAWYGVILLIVCGSVVYFIEVARGGRDLKIRKIAGLDAVTEAVGRATEMGRPCLFVPGILDINDIQTVAGLTVLSRVATLCAEYDAHLEVPTSKSLVMTAASETVASAYLTAGRPDAFRADDVYYLTDEQFGYVAGVTGQMVREKPAACFYMGAFFAESLFLAETGNSVGAIQIAGTAEPAQLPFFVAACDYTLLGEEFFAASAYLSGEPHQLGSLKGQDVGKLIGALLIIIGAALATFASLTENATVGNVVTYLEEHILGDKGIQP
ncbi:MAG: DUF6754 domain-containing protein [Planctomycetaceae bacterium]